VPGRRLGLERVADLAVEILSPAHTPAEMDRKLSEYFAAGVRQVWIVDMSRRQVDVYDAPDRVTTFDERGELSGGAVLPGFSLKLCDLFRELDRLCAPH
jgi:Uma2 family endonuclease